MSPARSRNSWGRPCAHNDAAGASPAPLLPPVIADVSLVETVTLQGVLFLNQMNDLAFTVGDALVVLVEHQSTVSLNLPLRLLMYAARVYEKLIDKDAVYHRRTVPIPQPRFIVLYNGADEYPDHVTLRLSDAFVEPPASMWPASRGGMLELEVDVHNINRGHSEDIVARSGHLSGCVTVVCAVTD